MGETDTLSRISVKATLSDDVGSLPVRTGLLLLPVAAALGPYFLPVPLGGINLFGFRSLVIVLFAITLGALRLRCWEPPLGRAYVVLGLLWMVWGGVSVMWSPVFLPAVRDVFAVVLGFGVGIILLNVRGDERWGIDALRRGWILAFVVTGAVAAWEVATGNHLSSQYTARVPDRALIGVAQSTLEQPNNYGAFLLLAFPFLMWSREQAERRVIRWAYSAMVVFVPVLVVFSASRLAFLGLLAELAVFGALAVRGGRSRLTYFGLVGLLALVTIWVFRNDPRLVGKLSSALGGEFARGGSIAMRWALTVNGLWFIMISGGVGIGAGGFQELMREGVAPHYAGGLVDPHNYWLEIGSQYGVVVLAGFLTFLGVLGWVGLRARQRPDVDQGVVQFLLVGLTGYLVAALANSSYLLQSTNWMFVATILIVGVHVRRAAGWSEA